MDLLLVLHAHLPWVKDATYPGSIEERWLFEALWESYLPLLGVLDRAATGGLRDVLTLSLSPTLLAMLGDARLQGSFLDHLDALEDVARHAAHGESPERVRAVAHHLARIRRSRARYLDADRDVAGAFGAHHRRGTIELITTAATHALLPAQASPAHVRAQIAAGLAALERACGVTPAGMWLPECAYDPRLDAVLVELAVGFTVLDAHGLSHGIPCSPLGSSAPIVSPSGLAIFPRDTATARRVWSRREGYPGDPAYREFHRDVASELDDDALGKLAPPTAMRTPVGIRPYRVTGPGDHKEPYDPSAASARAGVHALDFVSVVEATLSSAPRVAEAEPLLVAAYDAELFGHWWWEGPEFIERVIHAASARPSLRLATPSSRLASCPFAVASQPAASTWGEGGYFNVWASADTGPMLREVHRVERAVQAAFATCEGIDRRAPSTSLRLAARDGAARELMLAAASDWAFLVRTGTNVDYARRRATEHARLALDLCRIARCDTPRDGDRRRVDRALADGPPEALASRDILEWSWASR